MIEGTTTAVSAGILLGGFVVGLLGLVLGWARPRLEAQALKSGYIGGIAGMAAVVADITIRYIY